MTYLGWIGGATGQLYFKHDDASRQLRLPASPVLYAEATRLAAEAQEIGPSIAARAGGPAVRAVSIGCSGDGGESNESAKCLRARAFRERLGSTLVLVANTANSWLTAELTVEGLATADVVSAASNWGGTYCADSRHRSSRSRAPEVKVEVLFEHRNISVDTSATDLRFTDFIAPLGTRAYRIHSRTAVQPLGTNATLNPANLLFNPSFEAGAPRFPAHDWRWCSVFSSRVLLHSHLFCSLLPMMHETQRRVEGWCLTDYGPWWGQIQLLPTL